MVNGLSCLGIDRETDIVAGFMRAIIRTDDFSLVSVAFWLNV